jgi:hypothetical protein
VLWLVKLEKGVATRKLQSDASNTLCFNFKARDAADPRASIGQASPQSRLLAENSLDLFAAHIIGGR